MGKIYWNHQKSQITALLDCEHSLLSSRTGGEERKISKCASVTVNVTCERQCRESRSQSSCHAFLFCVLALGFSKKRENGRSLQQTRSDLLLHTMRIMHLSSRSHFYTDFRTGLAISTGSIELFTSWSRAEGKHNISRSRFVLFASTVLISPGFTQTSALSFEWKWLQPHPVIENYWPHRSTINPLS